MNCCSFRFPTQGPFSDSLENQNSYLHTLIMSVNFMDALLGHKSTGTSVMCLRAYACGHASQRDDTKTSVLTPTPIPNPNPNTRSIEEHTALMTTAARKKKSMTRQANIRAWLSDMGTSTPT